MKTSELKQIIKESVKEVVQEELKNVLLEIIKIQMSNNSLGGNGTMNPRLQTVPNLNELQNIKPTPQLSGGPNSIRNKYMQILEETTPFNVNESDEMEFRPSRGSNELGVGEVSLNQISGLLPK